MIKNKEIVNFLFKCFMYFKYQNKIKRFYKILLIKVFEYVKKHAKFVSIKIEN